MKIKVKFQKHLPEQRGIGSNGEWIKNEFVCEKAGQFPIPVCFSIWGDKSALVRNLLPGQEIIVEFDVSSREYNGKYFTELKAYGIETTAQVAQQDPVKEQPADSLPLDSNGTHVEDDLPF